jgi:hypothetical protein
MDCRYNSAEIAHLVQMLFTGSLKLNFPVNVAARASIGLHKYLKVQFSTIKHADTIGTLEKDTRHTTILLSALLFVFSKACEHLRSIRDVVNVVKALMVETIETGEEYKQLKSDIVKQEQMLLRALDFNLDEGNDHHKFLLNFSYFLQQENYLEQELISPTVYDGAVKTALTLLNDFFLISACTEHSPAMAAAACLCIALAVCVPDVDEGAYTASGNAEHRTNASKSQSQSQSQSIEVTEQAEQNRRLITRGQARLCRAMHVSEADMDRVVSDVMRAQGQFLIGADGKIIGVSPDSRE